MAGLLEVNLDQVNRGIIGADVQTHATATATLPAVAGKCNVVRHVFATYSATPGAGAKFVLKFGTTVKATMQVPSTSEAWLDFGPDGVIDLTVNQAITAVLDDGGSGVIGTIVIDGYPTDAPA